MAKRERRESGAEIFKSVMCREWKCASVVDRVHMIRFHSFNRQLPNRAAPFEPKALKKHAAPNLCNQSIDYSESKTLGGDLRGLSTDACDEDAAGPCRVLRNDNLHALQKHVIMYRHCARIRKFRAFFFEA